MLGEHGGHQQGCGQRGIRFHWGQLGLMGKQVPVTPALLPVGLAAQRPFSLPPTPGPGSLPAQASEPTASISSGRLNRLLFG